MMTILGPWSVRGQESNHVIGVVEEVGSGRPVPAAAVGIVGQGQRALTGDDGRFVLRQVPLGSLRLRVSAFGYEAVDVPVEVAGGGTPEIRVLLRPAPISLDEIVIAPGRFGILEVSPAAAVTTVTRADIEAVPQFGDDVFRTLKRMPGIVSEDLSAKLSVRGSTAKDLLVRLDGLELDEPYHLKDFDGVFGIVDVQSLNSIELITGGFPVEFGDKWGGMFDMNSRRPPASGGVRTTLGMSLSSLSVNSQGVFADGRGQWLASLRRGYLDIVLGIAGVEDELSPAYWDALARTQYLLSDNHVLSVEILHAGDDVTAGEIGSEERVVSSWQESYAWATWNARFAPGVRARTMLSWSRFTKDRQGVGGAPGDGVFKPTRFGISDLCTFRFVGLEQDWQIDLGRDLLLKTGFDSRFGEGEYDYLATAGWRTLDESGQVAGYEDTTAVSLAPDGHSVGAYTALRGRAGSDVTWEAGVRYDRQSHTGDDEISPRFMLRWDAGEHTSVKGSWGRYFQSQRINHLAVADGATEFAHAERADQFALGVERRFGSNLSGRLEAYVRDVDDPEPVFWNLAREANTVMEVMGDRTRLDPTRGRARGMEALLSYEGAGSLTWSAGYMLARSEFEIDDAWVPRTLDQTHTFNLYAAYRRGSRWQFSGSWQYHSGWPVTDQVLERHSVDDAEGEAIYSRSFGPVNGDRLPAYHRLDLRVTRAFEFERSRLELFLDVFNVYNRTNLAGFDYYLPSVSSGQTGTRRRDGDPLFPRLPTIGFRWIF